MLPRTRREHDEANETDPQSWLQGEGKQSWLPWRLSVDQAARAFGVETQHPVTHDL
jgi:hypothetical protein